MSDYTTAICILKKRLEAFKCFRIFKEMVENETDLISKGKRNIRSMKTWGIMVT
jgi:hypothetical protein